MDCTTENGTDESHFIKLSHKNSDNEDGKGNQDCSSSNLDDDNYYGSWNKSLDDSWDDTDACGYCCRCIKCAKFNMYLDFIRLNEIAIPTQNCRELMLNSLDNDTLSSLSSNLKKPINSIKSIKLVKLDKDITDKMLIEKKLDISSHDLQTHERTHERTHEQTHEFSSECSCILTFSSVLNSDIDLKLCISANLTIVNISKCNVSQINNLRILINLKDLNCSHNNITNIHEVVFLNFLEVLDCSFNDIEQLPEFCSSIRILLINNNKKIKYIPKSLEMSNIETVNCSHCSIDSVQSLENSKIKNLICTDNMLSDCLLLYFPYALKINVDNNFIDYIMVNHTRYLPLQELSCKNCGIITLFDFRLTPNLTHLNCSYNPIFKLLNIGKLTKLTFLDTTGTFLGMNGTFLSTTSTFLGTTNCIKPS